MSKKKSFSLEAIIPAPGPAAMRLAEVKKRIGKAWDEEWTAEEDEEWRAASLAADEERERERERAEAVRAWDELQRFLDTVNPTKLDEERLRLFSVVNAAAREFNRQQIAIANRKAEVLQRHIDLNMKAWSAVSRGATYEEVPSQEADLRYC